MSMQYNPSLYYYPNYAAAQQYYYQRPNAYANTSQGYWPYSGYYQQQAQWPSQMRSAAQSQWPTMVATTLTQAQNQPAAAALPATNLTDTVQLRVPEKPRPVIQLPPIDSIKLDEDGGIPYSLALQLVQANRVKEVEIQQDVESLTALPMAVLKLNTGEKFKTTLPPTFFPFTQALEDNAIPYGYDRYEPSRKEQTAKTLTQTLKETIMPLVIFGLTMGLGFMGFRMIRPIMERGPIEDALSRSIKTFENVPVEPDQILKFYDPDVQELVNSFRAGGDGAPDFLIAQGPPGTGKTFLLQSVARERVKAGKTVVLDPYDSRVRGLLGKIYGGDEVDSRHAQKVLKKMHGQDFDEIVLMVNEFENYPDLNRIIVDAMGNADGKLNFPKLRILATSNTLPDFGMAEKSRVTEGVMYIDYADPYTQADIILEKFSKSIPGFNVDLSRQTVTDILIENPGYSTRSLTKVANAVVQEVRDNPERDPKTVLRSRLFKRPLDDGEIAGLIRQTINQKWQAERRPWKSPGGQEIAVLNRRMMNEVEKYTGNLGVQLYMGGKVMSEIMNDYLDDYIKENRMIPTMSNEYITMVKNMANSFHTRILYQTELEEVELAENMTLHFAHFIEKTIEPKAFGSPLTFQKVLRTLRSPMPLPEIREEMMEVAEYYADNVKEMTAEELKQVFAAACDPVAGKLDELPEHPRNMALSMRKVLKMAVKAAK